MNGVFKARAVEWALGYSEKGNEQIAIRFELSEGEHAGQSRTYFGNFGDNSLDFTLNAMRNCGWQSDSLAELDDLGVNEVELVIEEQEYQGKWRDQIRWVNRPAALVLKKPMGPAEMQAFAQRMRGATIAHKQNAAPPRASTPAAGARRPAQHRETRAAAAASGALDYDASIPAGSGGDDDIPF